MMNLVALCLVMASLAGAGVFSPTPHVRHNDAGEQTIVKEGHRVVVVEYDEGGHRNTKISITPDHLPHGSEKFIYGAGAGDHSGTKDRIKEAASILPNVGQGLSQDFPHNDNQYRSFLHSTPKELICDAYGKCKHKISDAIGRTKESAEEAIDTSKDEAEEVRETISDAAGKAKDTVSHTAHNVRAKAKDALKGAKEIGETVADSVGKAKETVSHRTHYVQEKAKETLKEAKDTGNTFRKDVSGNVSEAVKNVRSYIGSSKEMLDQAMSVANLMGFATAYGLCVWVTFVSSYVLSRAMPRQQFGVVQSKIYPVYFRTMAYSVGLALLGHVLRHRKTLFFSKAEMLQAYNLLASLFTVFVNSMYLEPRATKVMFERMKIEKEEGRGRGDFTAELNKGSQHTTRTNPAATAPTKEGGEKDVIRSRIIRLNDKLKKLNSYSSLLNILNLMSLTWHLVYLAQCLHHDC
ncbi:uncharacterized protein LOC129314571 [Prosopis cineraria]|uniref:uncharacterized protein LOC129314571 n=1 Tax=Prosopis cineraria TaxID=364024 RepID=UPI00240F9430|nr:uncharacterized protein LOC129314571 [Prosopis cineraria]XP_054814029.1 uncharacterized protein LOC129314571 [Prosopis cineraria]